MSPQRRHDPPPAELPKVKWTNEKIRDTPSCAFGKINFENVEHAGGKKPAKVGEYTHLLSTCSWLVILQNDCLNKQWKDWGK